MGADIVTSVKDPDLFDVVVVGSGLAGLACARRSALLGLKVAVVEQNPELGGHLLPFRRGNQVFEVGLHYIADCGASSRWQRAMGKLGVSLQLRPLDHKFEHVIDEASGNIRSLPASLTEYLNRVQERYPEVRSWARFQSDLELVWQFAQQFSFPLEPRAVLSQVLRSSGSWRLARLALTSAQTYFEKVLCLNEEQTKFCLLHHVLLGSDPRQMSAFIYLLVHRYYFEGPCFVEGGGEAMIKALQYRDVTYRVATPVVGLERNPDHGFEVRTKQGQLRSRSVVHTGDPRQLQELCDFSLPWLLRAQLARAKAPHALVVGYYGTKTDLQTLGFANANYWLRTELNLARAYESRDLLELANGADVYLSMGSLRDPQAVAPGGKLHSKGVFQAMFLVPPDATLWGGSDPNSYRLSAAGGGYRRDYLLIKNKILKVLTDRLLRNFPCLKGELLWKELGTPLTHSRYLHSSTLGGYGFASTREDLIWARPGWNTGIPGLYLCGAHTKPTHGIVTSLLGGVGVAEKIAASLGRTVPNSEDPPVPFQAGGRHAAKSSQGEADTPGEERPQVV